VTLRTPSYAKRAVLLLEEQLRANPPPGVSDAHLVRFFAQHGEWLEREMEGLIARELAKDGMLLLLRADLNFDFSPGTHQASIQLPPQWVRVGSLGEAQQRSRAYIEAHALGGGNWTGGDVYRDGQPYARISYNGRIWSALDDEELDAQGQRMRTRGPRSSR
jgi:hypothetical protein